MIFTELHLRGAFVIDLDRLEDERGFFARTFCREEFEAHGLNPCIAQSNVAFNPTKGTVRGMHFQYPPCAETKLVRVTRGAVLDVILDLRPESPTYLQHAAVELTAATYRALYVPERFAHGYQALEDGTEVIYDMGAPYSPADAGSVSAFARPFARLWPLPVSLASAKDRTAPALADIEHTLRQAMSLDTRVPAVAG